MRKGTYLPYRKADNPPVYMNNCSNHLPMVIKKTTKIDKQTTIWFDIWLKPAYRDALYQSGSQEKLSYTSAQNKNYKNDKQRKRKIIWNNPPYSANVKTIIGKTFLSLIKKHFPKTNKLHKIFNKNIVKISFSYLSNISSIISGHNKIFLNPTVTQHDCNCLIREKIAPSKISAWHQILFIELMSIAR